VNGGEGHESIEGIEGIMSIPGAEDTIDQSTFEQILEMDEDEAEREFSKSIVYDFFTQAEGTFVKMDTSLCVASLPHLHEHTAD
jgi:osomolarity two-component system phosphorelay intermediate protein YPD1